MNTSKLAIASGLALAALIGTFMPSIAAATEGSPALAANESSTLLTSAGKDVVPISDDITPVTFSPANHGSVVGDYIEFDFNCADTAPGHPYIVFDRTGIFQPVTYNTGDGNPIGHYESWEKGPFGIASDQLFGGFTGAWGAAHRDHHYVTVFCAAHKEQANQ